MGYPIALGKDTEENNTRQLETFIIYLWKFGMNKRNVGNSVTTIGGKLSAVRWYHLRMLRYVPKVNAGLKLTLDGMKRFGNPVQKKHPVTAKMLRRLYDGLDLTLPKYQMLWGSALLGYFFLLRRSEYLQLDGLYYPHALMLGDLNFYDVHEELCDGNDAVMVGILLRGAKNNQYGREERRFQFSSGDDVLCPVMAVKWIRKAARHYGTSPQSPATSMGPIKGLHVATVVQHLKSVARSMGLNPANYSSHSLRIGGATALLNSQCSPLVIKLLGRWISSCFESYPVLLPAGCVGLSRLMC